MRDEDIAMGRCDDCEHYTNDNCDIGLMSGFSRGADCKEFIDKNDVKTSDINLKSNKSYDTNFKRFFARKDVLAGIMINVIPEYEGLTHTQVMDLIELSEINDLNAELLCTEDVDEKQKIIYDVVVKTLIPKNGMDISSLTESGESEIATHLIFDLEMQRIFNTAYPIMNRAVYYVSRLISKQNISGAKYGKLLPVRSVWICLKGIPKDLQDKAFTAELVVRDSNGLDYSNRFRGTDLIGINLLLLSENDSLHSNSEKVIKFLYSIFHDRMRDRELNPYVTVTPEVEREVQAIMFEQEQFYAETEAERLHAEEQGLKRGREEGREEGRGEGMELAIKTWLSTRKDIMPNTQKLIIIGEVIESFKLDVDLAEKIVNDFFNEKFNN